VDGRERSTRAEDVADAHNQVMGERMDLNCEIRRWVSDEPQPGIVEAAFTDARGKSWVIFDKCAIFTAEAINRDSAYPRAGVVRCEVLGRRRGASGGSIARVRAIDNPMTEGDIEEFEVAESLLTPPA
jgi:hypothetical protein